MKQPDICPRHGGTWGDDDMCMVCTTEDAEPRDVSNYARFTITIDVIVEEDPEYPVSEDQLALAHDINDLLIEEEYLEIIGTYVKKEEDN